MSAFFAIAVSYSENLASALCLRNLTLYMYSCVFGCVVGLAAIISPLVSTATPSFAPGDDPASLSSRTQPVPSPANQTSDPTTPAPNMAASPVAEVPPTVSIPGSPHPVQTKEIADRAAPPTGETPSAAVPLNPQGVPPIPSRAQSSTTDNASAFPSPRAQGQGIKQGGAPSTPQTATPLAAGSPAQSHHLAPSQARFPNPFDWNTTPRCVSRTSISGCQMVPARFFWEPAMMLGQPFG